MKGIFKLFPVALALVALASCSSDDLTGDNVAQVEFDPSKLYVTVENYGEDITRAGWEAHPNAAKTTLTKALFFQNGDQLKVYDEKTNWRPQLWEYEGTANVTYTGSAGVAGGESSIFTLKSTNAKTQYVNGYGVFPAALGEFKNENRSRMEFDLSPLKKMDYKTGASTKWAEDGKAYYVAYLPMWGVAKESAMTMKYLTGILRIDMNLFPAITGANAATQTRYLVVVGDKQLWSAEKVSVGNDNPSADGAIDPEKLNEEAPQINAADVGAAWTAGTDITIATPAENVMLIDLKNLAATDATAADLIAYIPVLCGNTNVKVYYSNQIDRTKATIEDNDLKTDGEYNLIGELDDAKIKAYNEAYSSDATGISRGITYVMVNDDNNKNATATSPFEMVQAIIAADKEAYRDFTITFTKDILVDNTDGTPQRQWIDFQNTVANYGLGEAYNLKHKVTVKAKLEGVGTNPTLHIKNIGGEKLTLNITQGSHSVDINVTDGLTSELVLDGALKKVTNASSDKLTIAGKVDTDVTTEGNITIDASAPANTVADLIISKGCTKVNVLDGTVTKVEFTEKTDENNKQIDADVEFHTEGTGYLKAVDYKNVPQATDGKTFAKTISYTSKWDGKTPATVQLTSISCGTDPVKGLSVNGVVENVEKAITSAAQLAGYNVEATTRILAKEIDLDGKDMQNAHALAGALNGNYNVFAKSADAAAAAAIAQANIKNLQIDVANGNLGLFQTSAANGAVYNLKISDAKILGKIGSNSANIGTLIGKTEAAVTVQNVDVTGLTATITGKTNYAGNKFLNIGGVIGQVSGDKATMLDVTTTGAISANGSLGGIIGNVSNTGTAKFGDEEEDEDDHKFNAVDMCSSTITLTPTAGQAEYDPVYAMVGTFVGSNDYAAAGAAGVEIYTKTALTPSMAVPVKAKFSRIITSTHAILRYNIERGLDEVGFSGINEYDSPEPNWLVQVFVSNNGTAAATAKNYVTKAYTDDAPNKNGWTIANWAALTTPVYCGWNISTQYVTE